MSPATLQGPAGRQRRNPGDHHRSTVKLIPPPQDKRTFLAYFDDIRTAGEAVSKIIAAKIIPSTMEIMDKATINCVEDYVKIGLPREMAALLLIEVDGHPAVVAEEAEEVRAVLNGSERQKCSSGRCRTADTGCGTPYRPVRTGAGFTDHPAGRCHRTPVDAGGNLRPDRALSEKLR